MRCQARTGCERKANCTIEVVGPEGGRPTTLRACGRCRYAMRQSVVQWIRGSRS